MSPFTAAAFYPDILKELVDAPPSQIDPELRKKVSDFLALPTQTDAVVYDFMDSVAEAAFHDQASSFVMILCDVRSYYDPPIGSKFYKAP